MFVCTHALPPTLGSERSFLALSHTESDTKGHPAWCETVSLSLLCLCAKWRKAADRNDWLRMATEPDVLRMLLSDWGQERDTKGETAAQFQSLCFTVTQENKVKVKHLSKHQKLLNCWMFFVLLGVCFNCDCTFSSWLFNAVLIWCETAGDSKQISWQDSFILNSDCFWFIWFQAGYLSWSMKTIFTWQPFSSYRHCQVVQT